ncbi:hypothetical protein [Stieleria varia]|uniref:Uncharacterized protein n=1 Tax=Stieleria varia TaxID=2528005 RepID=A0A5C6B311_9BACT|nr:hypothetical protein [Stieleria varia]TWU05636.1 hypothetical protein Pla52n_13510 [Stieleria varia]
MPTKKHHHGFNAPLVTVSCSLILLGSVSANFAVDTDRSSVSSSVQLASAEATEQLPAGEIPSGWRRTAHGWEDASKWRVPAGGRQQSLDEWISATQKQEIPWTRALFSRLRRIPPLMIATIQISLVAVIYRISLGSKWNQESATS